MRLYQFLDGKQDIERPHETVSRWLEPDWVTREKEAKAEQEARENQERET